MFKMLVICDWLLQDVSEHDCDDDGDSEEELTGVQEEEQEEEDHEVNCSAYCSHSILVQIFNQ